MLSRRLLSAAVIISVMLLLLFFDHYLGRESSLSRPGLVLSALAVVVAVLAAGEFIRLFENAAAPVHKPALLLASFTAAAITCVPVLWNEYPVDCPLGRFGFAFSGPVAGFVIMVLGEMWRYDIRAGQSNGEVLDRLGRSTLTLLYISMLIGFLINHRFLEQDNTLGLFAIVAMITTVKLSDSTAYFTGKAFGKHKLAPSLSPGKTIEGSLGGLVGGCLGAAICVYAVAPLIFGITVQKSWAWVLLYGLLVTLAGMLGDLAESLIKRDSNTKDSSRWLPGLGGILDVIDSLVFAAPVSFLLWI